MCPEPLIYLTIRGNTFSIEKVNPPTKNQLALYPQSNFSKNSTHFIYSLPRTSIQTKSISVLLCSDYAWTQSPQTKKNKTTFYPHHITQRHNPVDQNPLTIVKSEEHLSLSPSVQWLCMNPKSPNQKKQNYFLPPSHNPASQCSGSESFDYRKVRETWSPTYTDPTVLRSGSYVQRPHQRSLKESLPPPTQCRSSMYLKWSLNETKALAQPKAAAH